ncbi:MAG: LLM class flavin-dependent oxidoreductase [Betaproteobacteria bacterium]|nr:LLM class flavin-dependent oxidoreductase [Betaproteobacteria bacterium]
MEIGLLLVDTPRSMPANEQLDLALRQLEWGQKAGMRCFMLTQHWGYGPVTILQPIPLAARLSAELEQGSRIGTGIMVAPAYHPIALAEEAATLDVITQGRFILGLGNGYIDAELRALGVAPTERAARFEEILKVLPRIWRENEVSHAGRFFPFDKFEPHIVPSTPGGPPVWVGAKSLAGVRRAARLADAWVGPSKIPFDGIESLAKAYHQTRKEHGRPPGAIALMRQIYVASSVAAALEHHHSVSSTRLDIYQSRSLDLSPTNAAGETLDARKTALLGTPDQIVERARWLKERCGATTLITRAAWLGMSRSAIHDECVRLADGIAALNTV